MTCADLFVRKENFRARLASCENVVSNSFGHGRSLFAKEISMGLILLIILIVLLLGAVPAWPYSRNWGFAPSGGLGLVLLIVVVLLLMGRI